MDEYVLLLETHRIKVREGREGKCVYGDRVCNHHIIIIHVISYIITYVTSYHTIQLVAKLKAVFDRFDYEKDGRLRGESVEQALVYMNRPVDSHQVPDTFYSSRKIFKIFFFFFNFIFFR